MGGEFVRPRFQLNTAPVDERDPVRGAEAVAGEHIDRGDFPYPGVIRQLAAGQPQPGVDALVPVPIDYGELATSSKSAAPLNKCVLAP